MRADATACSFYIQPDVAGGKIEPCCVVFPPGRNRPCRIAAAEDQVKLPKQAVERPNWRLLRFLENGCEPVDG
jgi:hypothetical protein